jgi:hypothetical protein
MVVLQPMVDSNKHDGAMENQAVAVLSVALAQVNAIDRALAVSRDSRLASVRERALEIVSEIRSALQSGDLTASSLAALAASVNMGEDAASLVAESESAGIAAKVELASASIESHGTVSRMAVDLFEKHEFDADVARHTRGAEFEAFKKREAEDERYIRQQLARGTPGGDLNASRKMQGYMLDANAHGAGDNPDFMSKWNELKEKTDRLRQSMRAAGRSTEEYDNHIREDVAEFLKAKGFSDAQTREALAKSKDSLDAVKPHLSGDSESKKLANEIRLSADAKKDSTNIIVADDLAEKQPSTIDVDAMNARLAAAGLDVSPKSSETTGHGLTIQKPKAIDVIER